MLKEFLSQKGVLFKEYDVSRDAAAAQEMINRTGQQGVPVTVMDGQVVIGFDKVRIEQLLSRHVQHPAFGAAIADAVKITAQKGMAPTQGAYIGLVRTNSVAEKLGLAVNDIIVEINKQNIMNASDMESILSQLNPGNRISIIFLRNNQTLNGEGIF
jgi:glutaredoxin